MARIASSEDDARYLSAASAPVWTVDDLVSAGVDNPSYYDSESGLCTKVPVTDSKKQLWPSPRTTMFPRSDVKNHCNGRLAILLVTVLLLLMILVATAATVAYIAVGEQRVNWEDQEFQQDDEGISVVEGRLRITNRIFTKDLANSKSQSYLKLSAQVKQSMDAVFLQSGLAPYYNETGVIDYQPGSVVVHCRIHLSQPRLDATHQVGMAVIQALEREHGFLPGGFLEVDIRSLHFVGLQEQAHVLSTEDDLQRLPVTEWSPWSEWTPCELPCSIQSRSRHCLKQPGSQIVDRELCKNFEDGNKQIRNCPCPPLPPPTQVESQTDPSGNDECGRCGSQEVCLLLSQSSTARCLVPRDTTDPTGCGGWCVGQHEICKQINNNTFQCIDNSECQLGQWRCWNGLCISANERCDGQFDCYDMSDEYDCACEPGELHCGNNTSCLPQSTLCNGKIDCWDGSDELNCTLLCPGSRYTCNSGRCIEKLHFCDGYPDCDDGSDEPEGCSAPCLHTQHQCRNGRCVNTLLWCNSVDNCGDGTDEMACDTPLQAIE